MCSKLTPGALRSPANYLGPVGAGCKVVICSPASHHLTGSRPPSLREATLGSEAEGKSSKPPCRSMASGCSTRGAAGGLGEQKGEWHPISPSWGRGEPASSLNSWASWKWWTWHHSCVAHTGEGGLGTWSPRTPYTPGTGNHGSQSVVGIPPLLGLAWVGC